MGLPCDLIKRYLTGPPARIDAGLPGSHGAYTTSMNILPTLHQPPHSPPEVPVNPHPEPEIIPDHTPQPEMPEPPPDPGNPAGPQGPEIIPDAFPSEVPLPTPDYV